MSAFNPIGTLETLPIWTGIIARCVEGREMTFAVVELDAHASAVMHQHPNEQIGLVLRGTMTFTIGDETRELRAGDTYVIPGNVPHEAIAGADGAVVIDVFAPIRADWQRIEPQPSRTPIWP
ncbi:MAG TPA: cupin domain-containing protein [Vicinamibacterales bacterium]|nr:cupin domain-containing protein [Vicinamibacterales bacterium]